MHPRVRRPLLLATLAAVPLGAQPSDTAHVSHAPLFTGRDAAVAGIFALSTVAIAPADRWLAGESQQARLQHDAWLRRVAVGVREIALPGSLVIGAALYGAGRVGGAQCRGRCTDWHRAADLGLHGTEAIGVGLLGSGAIKGLAGRARPYASGDDPWDFGLLRGFRGDRRYESFPSGHTVMAFSAASAVTAETARWWPRARWLVGGAMYGGAGLVGLSRMYDNQHWASDVLVGAAIGTFSGEKIVRYHQSHPGNRLDRWLLSASLTPAAGGAPRLRLTFGREAPPRGRFPLARPLR